MSASLTLPTIASDWHRVGADLAVRFHLVGDALDVHWKPRRPTKREHKRLLPRYRAARHAFLLELSQRTGRTVMCVEV